MIVISKRFHANVMENIIVNKFDKRIEASSHHQNYFLS